MRRLAVVILRNCGYKIQESNNAFEALAAIRRNPRFDLVLTDVIMPQMSGKELSDKIKAQWPQTKILLMSGYTVSVLLTPTRQGEATSGKVGAWKIY